MSILQNMAIKHKLIAIIMLTCIIGLVLAGAAFIGWERSTFRREMVRNLSTQAEMIAENCKAALAFQDAKDAEKILQALHVDASIVVGCVYNKDKKLFATYYRDYAEIKVHPSELQESGFSFAEGFLTVYKPIVLDGEVIGTVCLRCDMSPMHAMLKRNMGIIVFVILLSCLAGLVVSARIQKVISVPILSLAESAIKIGKGDLTHRVQIQSKDELGYLANSFNKMAGNLEQTTTSIDNLNREIAQRKLAEQEAKKLAEEWITTFNSITDMVSIQDKDFKLVKVNKAFADTFKAKPEEIVGNTCYELVDGTKEPRPDCPCKRTFDTKKPYRSEFFEPRLGVYLEVSSSPIFDEKGEVIACTHIVKDITERKKAERALEKLNKDLESANQELGRSNKELQDFAYIVSHDLKAPLRGIKTLASWMSTDYADKLDEEGKEQMNLLLSRVDRMHNLIDGILQYSRVGRTKEQISEVNLNELVRDIIDMIASSESITVTVENELPVIECEKTRIIQVFQNLLSNAIKYMDKPQGQIRVGCVEDNGFWRFSVADNGPGIEEKYFEKIFQIFQTLSPRDEVESTGVGLTVVKKIVEMYGGKIWVESKLGEGSTFFFTLPRQKVGGKDAKPKASIVSRR